MCSLSLQVSYHLSSERLANSSGKVLCFIQRKRCKSLTNRIRRSIQFTHFPPYSLISQAKTTTTKFRQCYIKELFQIILLASEKIHFIFSFYFSLLESVCKKKVPNRAITKNLLFLQKF